MTPIDKTAEGERIVRERYLAFLARRCSGRPRCKAAPKTGLRPLSLWLTLWESRTLLPERSASVEPESALAQNR